ncbi:MAG: hypothetical protein Q9219_004781 [cf. Caloplaca sp. 3 TL-2023]
MNDDVHIVERKFRDFQRSTSRQYICPYCTEGFTQEPRLWEHAKKVHRHSLLGFEGFDEQQARGQLRAEAIEKAYVPWRCLCYRSFVQKPSFSSFLAILTYPISHSSRIANKYHQNSRQAAARLPSDHNERHFNHHVEPKPTASGPLTQEMESANATMDPSKRIENFGKLTLTQQSERQDSPVASGSPMPVSNPLKRGPTEGPEVLQMEPVSHPIGYPGRATRREKAITTGPYPTDDPDFTRNVSFPEGDDVFKQLPGPGKRLYNPNLDESTRDPDTPRRYHVRDSSAKPHWSKDASPPASNPPRDSGAVHLSQSPLGQIASDAPRPGSAPTDRPVSWTRNSRGYPEDRPNTEDLDHDAIQESQPQIIRQPETRPISHDQLVVEVKGIYAGLILVEQKCKEVDEKQSAAALERDPSRRAPLSNEQWQALIALHKTLLHEHHDFFLASQHPSASPTLSKLAGKYSMPARMWRHGIHAFLEVLRHRLPASSDHMLAFIYIAYSMMALLYETVSAFEETWIECLGDLARYRMAIEEHDVQDREIWGGVARFWYSKAADKRPEIGRLCHHLAILARPNSLQQLSYYARSLACIIPFSSARSSIMTLFQPMLQAKVSAQHRPKALEIFFIKIHANLFVHGRPTDEVIELFKNIQGGLLDDYIGRITTRFREQGVSMALTNIATFFEYGALTAGQMPKSIFRIAFLEVWVQKLRARETSLQKTEMALDIDEDRQRSLLDSLDQQVACYPSEKEISSSMQLISFASNISFTILSIVLQRPGDKNVFPLVHVMFCFIWSLANVEKAMIYVERDIPWMDICTFLNALAKPGAMAPESRVGILPKLDEDRMHPLPEDFALRGQLCALWYYPDGRFEGAQIDIEERSLEKPSMAAIRVNRVLWLGMEIASVST